MFLLLSNADPPQSCSHVTKGMIVSRGTCCSFSTLQGSFKGHEDEPALLLCQTRFFQSLLDMLQCPADEAQSEVNGRAEQKGGSCLLGAGGT